MTGSVIRRFTASQRRHSSRRSSARPRPPSQTDSRHRLLSLKPDRLCRSREFYKVVPFEEAWRILLSDLAYAEVYFDGAPPPSVLQVPAQWISRWVHLDVQDLFDARLADRLCG
jgi:hypothetical protein